MRFDEGGILRVAGIHVDEVSQSDTRSCTDMAQKASLDQPESEVCDNIESLLQHVFGKGVPPTFGALDPDALWRTLVTDRSIFGSAHLLERKSSAPQLIGQMYEVFRGRMSIPQTFSHRLREPELRDEFIKPLINSLQLADQRFSLLETRESGWGHTSFSEAMRSLSCSRRTCRLS